MHGEKIMPSSSCETEGLKLAFLSEIVLYFKFIVSALCLKCLFGDLLEEKGFFLFIYTMKILGWFKDQKQAKGESDMTKQ